jgi:hypothetical protein
MTALRSMRPLVALLIAAMAGCASAPRGDPRQDAALKTFTIHPLRSGVFIFRDESKAGPALTTVQIDNLPFGFSAPGTYLYMQVPIGKHTLSATADGSVDAIDIQAEPGRQIYVWQEVKPAWSFTGARGALTSTTIKLHVVGEAEGRQHVLAAKLAENPHQPTRRVQKIEVRLEADEPALRAPMECEASNDYGRWPFVAPGTVEVQVSDLALEVSCKALDARLAEPLVVKSRSRSEEGAKSGAGAGGLVGGAIGLGVGVAAAPVVGPALGAVLVAGSALRGAEIGAIAGWVASSGYSYPDVVSVRVKARPAD